MAPVCPEVYEDGLVGAVDVVVECFFVYGDGVAFGEYDSFCVGSHGLLGSGSGHQLSPGSSPVSSGDGNTQRPSWICWGIAQRSVVCLPGSGCPVLAFTPILTQPISCATWASAAIASCSVLNTLYFIYVSPVMLEIFWFWFYQ